MKPKLAPADSHVSFAKKLRKYSINENEFSNDIFAKVNDNDCSRDITNERQYVDFNQISPFDEYMGTNPQ